MKIPGFPLGYVGQALIVEHPDLVTLAQEHRDELEKLRQAGALEDLRHCEGSGIEHDISYLEMVLDELRNISSHYGV